MVISRLIGCSPSTESIDVNNSTYSNILEETPSRRISVLTMFYTGGTVTVFWPVIFCFLQCPNYSFNSFFPLGYSG